MSTIETCIRILGLSNDGDDLNPLHLKLVEIAVNGYASKQAEATLARILANLEKDTYQADQLDPM